MAQHAPVQADPESIERAEKTWHGFVKASKWTILHIIVIMGILLLIYLNSAG